MKIDIVFHYPPDLFDLLVDTIPLLCKTKKGVLLFFQGAGVSSGLLDDLRQTVKQDKDSISKYEIVRTILTRLNEQGESTLRERREILKRVTEFENFSACWPNDQLKAKGLVAEIRRVMNVKDSFTRMKQERDREQQERQAKHLAKTKLIKQKQTELDSIKKELYPLFGMPDNQSQKRGKLLEGILNRLFEVSDVLVREAFSLVGEEGEGVIEQIDGVVEIDGCLYLVEMKWWKKPLGKEQVSHHLVRIYHRGHARGILISNSGYTRPAITICKEALSKTVVVLCELKEIVMLLEQQSNLKDFLKSKIEKAVIDKQPLFKPFN